MLMSPWDSDLKKAALAMLGKTENYRSDIIKVDA
jgi:hypothetical protein